MRIVSEYELSYPLYKRSFRLHRHKVLSRSVSYIVLFRVLPVGGFLCLALACYWKLTMNPNLVVAVGGAMALWFWYACGWLAVLIGLRRTYKANFPANAISRQVRVEVDELGINTTIANSVSSHVHWSSICRVERDDAFFLFYLNRARYIPILLLDTPAEQLVALQALAQEHVAKVPSC
jgi:hypothetical protein